MYICIYIYTHTVVLLYVGLYSFCSEGLHVGAISIGGLFLPRRPQVCCMMTSWPRRVLRVYVKEKLVLRLPTVIHAE